VNALHSARSGMASCARRMSNMKRIPKHLLSALVVCALAGACDKAEEKKADDKKAEPTAADKEVEERLAKKRAEREAAEKAAAEKVEAIKALAVLPEKMPKDLEEACNAVATAQDEFMKRNFDGEGLAKWEQAKGTQMGMLKTGCIKAQSLELAACQTNAMNNAPADFKKDLPDILSACMEKFGGG
jgi:hypothetical protein